METDEIIVIDSDSDSDISFKSSNSFDNVNGSDEQLEKTIQCPRCVRMFCVANGIILKACSHSICKECIIDYFFKNHKLEMICEFKTCGTKISEKEMRSVLNEVGMAVLDESDSQHHDTAKLNEIAFCCGICCIDCPVGRGVKLNGCSHHICEPCLRDTIIKNSDPEIRCPYSKSFERCGSFITDSEIKTMTSAEEYEKFKEIAIKKANEPSELAVLTMLDDLSYIQNKDAFDCPICFVPCDALEGIRLRECLHEFCLECFINTVTHSDDDAVKCPFTDENLSHCESFFQEREIRAVVSTEVYEKFLERKLKVAEHRITNTFHCKTIDCPGFGILETGDTEMICSICREKNCLQCKAIHKNQTCEDYQDSLTGYHKVTERYIDNLKNVGDVMNCPKCQALINKIAGCSYLTCTFCKTAICWATKGPRWGPKGQGDISGGCRCNIGGKRCHPQCENCH